MWSILGLFISFALIIVWIRSGREFGVAMLFASVVLAVLSQDHLTMSATLDIYREAVTSFDTLALTAGVGFIGILAYSMEETGEISSIVENVRHRLPEGGTLAFVPAIFGLLPVPGGALMSAPMTEEEADRVGISSSSGMFFNLWFRHIGFLIFPLAAPLLLLSHEAGVPLYLLILTQIPVFLVALVVGLFVIWRQVPGAYSDKKQTVSGSEPRYSLFRCLLPILVSVFLFFAISIPTKVLSYQALLVSVPVGVFFSLQVGSTSMEKALGILCKGFSASLTLSVFGIMIFYKVVQHSGLESTFSDVFLGTFLPLSLIIVVVAFLLGFAMGHNLGAVGVSYSILASSISGSLPLIALMYVSSFFGYLISPIHLCVAVSFDFFEPEFVEFYRFYLPTSILVLIFAVFLYSILL